MGPPLISARKVELRGGTKRKKASFNGASADQRRKDADRRGNQRRRVCFNGASADQRRKDVPPVSGLISGILLQWGLR